MGEDVTFREEKYSKDEKLSIKIIVLRHIKKISDLSCNEYKKGYWESKPVSSGGAVTITKTYHPDGRKSYINAIDFLLDMIFPAIDDKFKEELKKLEDLEEQEYERIINSNHENKNEKWINEKQRLRRKLFGSIILMLDRVNFFEVSDYEE